MLTDYIDLFEFSPFLFIQIAPLVEQYTASFSVAPDIFYCSRYCSWTEPDTILSISSENHSSMSQYVVLLFLWHYLGEDTLIVETSCNLETLAAK